MIQRLVFMVITCMITISPAVADEVKFLASAPKQVIQGQQFQVVLYVAECRWGTVFRAPDFSGFSVLYGPATSQSTSISWVNGKTSKISEYTYTYTLRADKEGSYTFAAATIMVDGKQLSSNSLRVQVLPPDKNAPAPSANGGMSGRQSVQSAVEDPECLSVLSYLKSRFMSKNPF